MTVSTHRILPANAVLLLVLSALLMLFAAAGVRAEVPTLARLLEARTASALLDGADAFGPVEGTPPAAAILKDGETVGYAFLNTDLVNATGYSGKPIHILIAMNAAGVVTHVELIEHHEPIVLIGIPEAKIRAFMNGYIGHDVVHETLEDVDVNDLDIIAGATVTIIVIDDSIRRSALKLARARGLAGLATSTERGPTRRLRAEEPKIEDWQTLLGDGSIRQLVLSVGDVNAAFAAIGQSEAAAKPEADDPEAEFIRLYVAPVSVPTIGMSLLGEREYENMRKRIGADGQAILLMGSGLYSFKGSGYVRGGLFDRFQLVAGDRAIRFRDRFHKRLGTVAAEGAPEFEEIGLYYLPPDSAFDPVAPWRIDLLVSREIRAREKAFTSFSLDYQLPERYVETIAPPQAADDSEAGAREALWLRVWRDGLPEILALSALLGVLTLIFFFQDWLVKRPRLTAWVRNSFLVIVLFWLGFYMNAQLSVVNVLTFANSLIGDFSWGYFLMAPLIFILWVGVAAGMLFWGRGVFCGWLCPFGALQELTNRLARRLGVKQIALPWGLNERLWALKYIIFLAIFGLSFYSMSLAERVAEVEPFKTAIIMNFMRAWPFVVFAGGLVVVNLFIERFFCRYLCPLGAALAIPGKLRMFDWLKRYRECGNPCQICAHACPTAAIHPDGRINVNECIYCLDCQKIYYDDHLCPKMIQTRLRRERRLSRTSDSMLSAAQKAERNALVGKKTTAPSPGNDNA